MSSQQHTPEPWHTDTDFFDGEVGHFVVDADGNAVCGRNVFPSKDNARLIAAAPELLEALVASRTLIQIDRDCLFSSHCLPDGTLDAAGKEGVGEYDAALSQIDAAIAKATGGAA